MSDESDGIVVNYADDEPKTQPEAPVEPENKAEPVKADEPEPEPKEEDATKEVDESERRLQELHKRTRIAERDAKDAREALKRLRGEMPADPNKDMEEKVRTEATRIAEAQIHTQKALEVIEKGRKEFGPEFDDVLKNLNAMSDSGVPESISRLVVEEMPQPARLINYLGKNPDVYENLLRQSPVKQAITLTNISNTLTAAKQTTKAPPPIKPVPSSRQAEPNPEDMDMEEYAQYRAKQLTQRKQRMWRP